ncbi:hypothetical protein JCM1840_000730 [Sporobolomyces johnsonii]
MADPYNPYYASPFSPNHLPPLPQTAHPHPQHPHHYPELPPLPPHQDPYQPQQRAPTPSRIVLKGTFAAIAPNQPAPPPSYQPSHLPPSAFQQHPAAAFTPSPYPYDDPSMTARTRRASSRQQEPPSAYSTRRGSRNSLDPNDAASSRSMRSTRSQPNYAEDYDPDRMEDADADADASYEGGDDGSAANGAAAEDWNRAADVVPETQPEEDEQPIGRGRAKKRTIADSEDEAYDEDAAGEDDVPHEQGDETGAPGEGGLGLRPRRATVKIPDDEEDEDDFQPRQPRFVATTTSSGRQTKRPQFYDEGSESDGVKPQRRLTRGRSGGSYRGEGIEQDEDWEADDGAYGESRARGSTRLQEKRRKQQQHGRQLRNRQSLTQPSQPKKRQTRNSRKAEDVSYEHDDDEAYTSPDTDDEIELDLHDDDDDDLSYGGGGAPAPRRNLRQKKKVNYYAPLQLEAPKNKNKGKQRRNDDGNPFAGLPANMTGAEWAALYPDGGQPSDSSDDDVPNLNSPSKSALFSSKAAAAAAGLPGGMLASGGGLDFGSGAPNNLGKVNGTAALADIDPLGVPSTVSFDSVGGLGSHIQQLKEMVSLPLLYPEVFERFAITPPRGVLFHGPPGTGKTLLARALAASCSTDGRKISFFMRKGADCLSKWVGEAERQLRLLFDEAKACQPSIIFFDEIDGLAPVRSSKQEQIHASIVSTLLALMDGMDGRGQVIVIGATNRPDAIDPALRRPGRFDREFYFPLPNVEARRKILDIHTKGWNPPLEEGFKDELAHLTKGYGGADLRALCTEAALNAVQRTYPQIYKTNDRLLIKPETIEVTARDFVISQKNMIPSSHRSTSSAAAALPPQLVPLLTDSFENAKAALAKVLPEVKRPNILEEAEWVDENGGFEKEKMLQAFETLRVFRPRLLICGEPGMGQGYVGAAVLHHLEGFHVQTLDLATLVSDSTRTMEAACVQLFVEAKRHKPSILFIPSLITWCSSVGETVRATIKGLLDAIDPSDPILLLAVVDGALKDVPADVRSWFGFVKGNRVTMGKPSPEQRQAFFADVLAGITRPPNEFPDAMPRRKRVLEKLPIAPPPPPREPTAAEIAQQEANDQRLLEYLKWRLGPVLNELKKRYKRFTRSLYDDWRSDDLEWRKEQLSKGEPVTGLGTQPYHNVDLDSMHSDLYKGYYYTPDDFLTDILRIQANAEVNKIMENDAEAPTRAGQMVNHVKVMLDQTFEAPFRAECEKMAARMREKEKNAPRKERKGKGKDLPEEGIVAAAQAAAAAGGATRLGARPSGHAVGGEGDEIDLTGEGDKTLKRGRGTSQDGMEGVDGGEEDEDEQGPAKRARAEGDLDGEPDVVTNLADGQAVASSSGAHTNSIHGHLTNGSSKLHDLLNPTVTSSLVPFDRQSDSLFASGLPPLPPVVAVPVAAPMPVGAVPSVSPDPPAPAAATSFLSGAISAPSNPFASTATASSASMVASTSQNGVEPPSRPQEDARDGTPTPVVGRDAMLGQGEEANEQELEKERSPTPMESTPPPLPDFVLPSAAVDAFASFLENNTSALSIDQLEQLRAACFDAVWRARSEWDRSRLVEELDELAREFVDEVESLAHD